ncbi:TPA: DUF6440 family protein [Bacillus anthracis]|nr:hypothetical protein [Bacillus cereus biovar anthracis]HDR6230949.1 hypothetical protein [Bacillus cereus biovar anthracis]HDR6240476.1 hypothetical protein [Bacillus cereus biovar anthracis]
MRKILTVLLSVGLLSGCTTGEKIDEDSGIRVWTDKDTGCQYFYMSSGYSDMMTPRMNNEGKQICKKAE